MIADLIFYLFAALAVVSGLFVVFTRNIVHAGFSLMFTLLGVAGLYGVLGADFLAVTQVIVYIGGVLVLVLFTVMMTRVPLRRRTRQGLDLYVPAGIFALAVFAVLYRLITDTAWLASASEPQPTVAEIGTAFMTTHIFAFEYVSIALLVAMIGAAILIRERRPQALETAQIGDHDAPILDDAGAPAGAPAEEDREEVHT
ncbi:MAG: NADH-quinone oxidoreductase subunit J [Candidatus Krumholzibacteriia bacterium]